MSFITRVALGALGALFLFASVCFVSTHHPFRKRFHSAEKALPLFLSTLARVSAAVAMENNLIYYQLSLETLRHRQSHSKAKGRRL